MFLATANVADTIPGPLLDRMEVIRFDGYTSEEKLAIAKGYLWPRQRDRNGLREDEVEISDDVLRTIISEYTREAGVRNLERELGTVLRKTATRIASARPTDGQSRPARRSPDVGQNGKAPGDGEAKPRRSQGDEGRQRGHDATPVKIDLEVVRDALGRQKFFQESAARTATPGVATGLAVTGTGGDVLFVEATAMKRRPSGSGLVLTGQLGDVMKESARIALSYVRGHAEELGIDESAFEDREFHVHVPGGRDPQGRPERRRDDGHRARLAAVRAPGQAHGRHDRRGHAAGPRAADRRAQAEGARRTRGRPDRRDPARAQPRRPGRDPRGGRDADDLPPGDDRRRRSSTARWSRHAMSRTSRRCKPVPAEVRQTADLLERRWQLSIIYAALTGALRFNEFADAIAGISPRMLSERLRDLEAAGLIERTVHPDRARRQSSTG